MRLLLHFAHDESWDNFPLLNLCSILLFVNFRSSRTLLLFGSLTLVPQFPLFVSVWTEDRLWVCMFVKIEITRCFSEHSVTYRQHSESSCKDTRAEEEVDLHAVACNHIMLHWPLCSLWCVFNGLVAHNASTSQTPVLKTQHQLLTEQTTLSCAVIQKQVCG